MNILDLEGATIWIRLLAAVLAFLVLAAIAAGALVGAMMFVLFSADATSTADHDDVLFNRVMYTVLFSLAAAVILPPIMLLFKMSAIHSAIPAGIGFTCAGVATMWYILVTLGAN
jgi:hypothetical protein